MTAAWTEEQREQVRGLLTQFSDACEVCAVLECKAEDLDELSRDAFGMDFAAATEKFRAQGKALIRQAQFQLAINGDRNMLQVLGREVLGQESATYKPKKDKKQPEEKAEEERANNQRTLKLLQSRYNPPKVANG